MSGHLQQSQSLHQHQHPQQQATSTAGAGPSTSASVGVQQGQQPTTIAPKETYQNPLVATGDWTKNLIHLAKTAELKKHALTLQLHTAHILSAHASLDQKNKAIQDVKEQKNKLESERQRLLNCLREVNEDRDKADLLEQQINKECGELRAKIQVITDGDYAIAKRDVDALRQELGQAPLPSERIRYLSERRMNGDGGQKRGGEESVFEIVGHGSGSKRARGRPKGSKNKTKGGGEEM